MKVYFLLAIVLAVIMGGCASSGMDSAFDANGYPKHQYYAGGGHNVDYTAWEEGTLILADRVSKKIIMTESLGREDGFNVEFDPEELKKIGLNPSEVELSIYYIPYNKAKNNVLKQNDGAK